MRRLKNRGFTLIELMIAVAIVAILAGIGYPSYTSHVKKSLRRAAQAQMLDIANRQQQFLLANRAYVAYSALTTSGYALPSELSARPLGALLGMAMLSVGANGSAPERVKMWTALEEPPPT